MALKTNRNTASISGAKAVFMIGDNIVAHASDCSYDYQNTYTPIEVIGNETVVEHCEMGITVSFNCTTFRIYNKSVTQLGIQPTLKNLLLQDTLKVVVKEKSTDNVLLLISDVKLQGRSGSISARGMFTEQLSFVGRTIGDEGDPTAEQSAGTPTAVKWGTGSDSN
jgi:hypothetical protein